MALQRTRLTPLAYIPASVGVMYDNPASTTTFVKGVLLHNTNTTAETIEIHWVPSSGGAVGTAGNATRLFKVQMDAGETLFLEMPYSVVLVALHESIQMVTTTASKVNCAIAGDQDA